MDFRLPGCLTALCPPSSPFLRKWRIRWFDSLDVLFFSYNSIEKPQPRELGRTIEAWRKVAVLKLCELILKNRLLILATRRQPCPPENCSGRRDLSGNNKPGPSGRSRAATLNKLDQRHLGAIPLARTKLVYAGIPPWAIREPRGQVTCHLT